MKKQEHFSTIIRESIKNNWDNPCICDTKSEELTYGEFGNRILAIHHFLSSKNVQLNDKIALVAPNSIAWCISYIAVITYGAVIVPISIDLPIESICKLIYHSDASMVLSSDDMKRKLEKPYGATPIYSLSSVLEYLYEFTINKEEFDIQNTADANLSIINYTSGTSGSPKGVMLSLVPIIKNLDFARNSLPLQKNDRIVSVMPYTHSFGSLFEFLYPFSVGATIYLLQKKPSPRILQDIFNKVKPRVFFSVPLVIEKIFKDIFPNFQDSSSLDFSNDELVENHRKLFMQMFSSECKLIGIGGAKLNPTIEKLLMYIGVPFACGYGMTECGPVISWTNPPQSKLHSVGKLVEGMQGKIINVKDGVGEILLKGTNLMLGYYKNPKETANAIDKEGWFHTGDIGYFDNDGYLFIKGRKSNIIIRSDGVNIYIDDIENTIKEKFHLIEDCVVFERNNKLIVSVVISPQSDSSQISLEDINKEIPRYARISKVEIVSTPVQRNNKNEILREFYK